jgi:hypothetical protein
MMNTLVQGNPLMRFSPTNATTPVLLSAGAGLNLYDVFVSQNTMIETCMDECKSREEALRAWRQSLVPSVFRASSSAAAASNTHGVVPGRCPSTGAKYFLFRYADEKYHRFRPAILRALEKIDNIDKLQYHLEILGLEGVGEKENEMDEEEEDEEEEDEEMLRRFQIDPSKDELKGLQQAVFFSNRVMILPVAPLGHNHNILDDVKLSTPLPPPPTTTKVGVYLAKLCRDCYSSEAEADTFFQQLEPIFLSRRDHFPSYFYKECLIQLKLGAKQRFLPKLAALIQPGTASHISLCTERILGALSIKTRVMGEDGDEDSDDEVLSFFSMAMRLRQCCFDGNGNGNGDVDDDDDDDDGNDNNADNDSSSEKNMVVYSKFMFSLLTEIYDTARHTFCFFDGDTTAAAAATATTTAKSTTVETTEKNESQ